MNGLRRLVFGLLCDAAAVISHLCEAAGPMAGPVASRRAGRCYAAGLAAGRVEGRMARRREAASGGKP